MADVFDTGEDDDDRVLAALQAIIREAGLDPYLDIRVPDPGTRGGVFLILNRAERALGELRKLDESVADAGEWNEVVFKPDPDLPRDYHEAGRAPAVLTEDRYPQRGAYLDRQREGERREAVTRAIASIGDLRRAVRNQA